MSDDNKKPRYTVEELLAMHKPLTTDEVAAHEKAVKGGNSRQRALPTLNVGESYTGFLAIPRTGEGIQIAYPIRTHYITVPDPTGKGKMTGVTCHYEKGSDTKCPICDSLFAVRGMDSYPEPTTEAARIIARLNEQDRNIDSAEDAAAWYLRACNPKTKFRVALAMNKDGVFGWQLYDLSWKAHADLMDIMKESPALFSLAGQCRPVTIKRVSNTEYKVTMPLSATPSLREQLGDDAWATLMNEMPDIGGSVFRTKPTEVADLWYKANEYAALATLIGYTEAPVGEDAADDDTLDIEDYDDLP